MLFVDPLDRFHVFFSISIFLLSMYWLTFQTVPTFVYGNAIHIRKPNSKNAGNKKKHEISEVDNDALLRGECFL